MHAFAIIYLAITYSFFFGSEMHNKNGRFGEEGVPKHLVEL